MESPKREKRAENLKFWDPACGSGHLIYALMFYIVFILKMNLNPEEEIPNLI